VPEGVEAPHAPPRIEKAPVVSYDRPSGDTVRVYVAGGYCIGEPPPSIERVAVREHRLPRRARIAGVITAFPRRPSPLEFPSEQSPPEGEGSSQPVPVCAGVEHPLHRRIALGFPVEEMVLLDGSTSPARPIPPSPGARLSRSRSLNGHVLWRRDRGFPCDRPSSSTLLETGKVRVYAMPKESASHPEQREPAIAGRPVFGCLKTTGKSRLLDLPETGGEKHAYWVEVDPQVLAVSAPLVAYAYTQYYLDTHETWIRVRNLRTGTVLRSCDAGGDLAPGRLPHVARIVLGSDGTVAWSAEGDAGHVVWTCGPSGVHQLDTGEGVAVDSLSLENGVVSWVDEGSVREAPLG
jgi:hypothetical protein